MALVKFIVDDYTLIRGAVVEEHTYMHTRTCSSFSEYDQRFGNSEGTWLSKGANHKLVPARQRKAGERNLWVYREEPRDVNTLDVADLDALTTFAAFYGPVRLEESDYVDVPWRLTFNRD